jgi:hypothetical protein
MSKEEFIKYWAQRVEIDSDWTLDESKNFLNVFYKKVLIFDEHLNKEPESKEYQDLLRRTD